MAAGTDTERLYAVNAAAAQLFAGQLSRCRPAVAYLHSRGALAASVAELPWQVGYAPRQVGAQRDRLHRLGFTDAELTGAGLLTLDRGGEPIEVFRQRVMFPIREPDGRVAGFTGRLLGGTRPGAGRVPRYRNTATTEVYQKGRHLYGLAEQSARLGRAGAVLLVEGPADVLAIAGLTTSSTADGRTDGVWAAVASCGTAWTGAQLAVLGTVLAPGTPLVVCFDADHAGRSALARADRVLRSWPGPLEAIALPAGEDPASLVARRGAAGAARLLRAARRPLVELLIEDRLGGIDLTYVEGRLAALRAVAPLAARAAGLDPRHGAELALRLTIELDLGPLTVYEAISAAPVERG